MKKIIATILIVLMIIPFASCAKIEYDAIAITSVEMSPTETKITVYYQMATSKQGELMVGCKDPETEDDYIMLVEGVVVNKKKGEYTFEIETSQIVSKEICADLSAYPHEDEWEPLATDYLYLMTNDEE